jgi:hypothetical protein
MYGMYFSPWKTVFSCHHYTRKSPRNLGFMRVLFSFQCANFYMLNAPIGTFKLYLIYRAVRVFRQSPQKSNIEIFVADKFDLFLNCA